MEIRDRVVEGCVIIDLSDDKFQYPKTLVLKNHVMHLLQNGNKHLVLNLSDVVNLDSFGIAVIISILKECKSQQGNLTLYGLNDTINRLMELTKMDKVLDIWESEGQAVMQVKR